MTLRERQRVQTRDHLIDTASEVFGVKGYTATSIEEIIDAAGTSRGTLYKYFDSKEALLGAIVQRMWDDGLEYYHAFGRLPDWSRSTILQWMREFVAAFERDAARNKAASVAAPAMFLEAPGWHRKMTAAVQANEELWSHFAGSEAQLRASMLVRVVETQLAEYFFDAAVDISTEDFAAYVTDAVRALLEVK